MKKIKLHHSLFIIAAIIYVCGALIFIRTQYMIEKGKLVSVIDKELFMAIDAAVYILPEDYGDRAIGPDTITEEEYNSIEKILTKYAHKYGVQYIYVLHKAEDGHLYEIATSSEVGNEPDFTYFGDADDMFDGRVEELHFLFEPYSGRDLKYIEYFEIGLLTDNRVACKGFTAKGGTPYMICADSDLHLADEKLRSYVVRQLIHLFFLFILVFPLLLAHRVRGKEREKELNDLVTQRTEELYLALQEANRLNNAKSEFLASMSHELRTPLNAIIGFSEIITMGEMQEKVPEYSKTINDSGRHLLSLINDILDFSKVEASNYSLNEANLSIQSIFDNIKGIISGYKNAAHKNITYTIDENIPMLSADERMIKQILLNVMSNSIKFTDKEDSRISLHAKYDQDKKQISFIISDNGAGINEKDQENIFEPFKQS
ncbi:MAG: hypothetical protein LBL47_02570, partial [Lactobacillus sp.]|nr:hypothetical protein [Lactobacillus sp.]